MAEHAVFDIGDIVPLAFEVKVNGVYADPDAVTVDVRRPDGVTSQSAYAGGAGAVIRDAIGIYVLDYQPTMSGRYWFRWSGAGTVQAVEESWFYVRASALA